MVRIILRPINHNTTLTGVKNQMALNMLWLHSADVPKQKNKQSEIDLYVVQRQKRVSYKIEFQIECKLMDKNGWEKKTFYFFVLVMCDMSATEMNSQTVHETEPIFFRMLFEMAYGIWMEHKFTFMIEWIIFHYLNRMSLVRRRQLRALHTGAAPSVKVVGIQMSYD